jgi:hypothetical protein
MDHMGMSGRQAEAGGAVPADRMTRRQALRRAALVGGALVYTTPAVTRLAGTPAFAVGTPPPEPPPPEPPPPDEDEKVHAISYVGLVFVCNGTMYKAKWEEGKGWVGPGNLPHCTNPDGWNGASSYPNPGSIGVSTTYVGGELHQVCFTLPDTCSFNSGAGGVVMGAGGDKTTQGFCVGPSISGRTACFTAP